MRFQKILCPVDFSVSSDRALDYALAIAKRENGEVSVMHVLPSVLADPDVYPYLAEPVMTTNDTRERALSQLGSFVHRALELRVASEVILEDGDIVDEVVKKSARLPADLVVMGTHGRRGFRRLLLGSVTERLLRQSTVPVLVVNPQAPVPERNAAPFRRVLCPVDFSPSSLAGLELATSLVGEDGELSVLHVVEFYFDPAVSEAVAFDVTEVRDRHCAQAQSKLEECVPKDVRARVRLETVVLGSRGAYQEILQFAEREASELIVIGVQGRSAADLLFFGSTTNHVVRQASCPVITVRSKG